MNRRHQTQGRRSRFLGTDAFGLERRLGDRAVTYGLKPLITHIQGGYGSYSIRAVQDEATWIPQRSSFSLPALTGSWMTADEMGASLFPLAT